MTYAKLLPGRRALSSERRPKEETFKNTVRLLCCHTASPKNRHGPGRKTTNNQNNRVGLRLEPSCSGRESDLCARPIPRNVGNPTLGRRKLSRRTVPERQCRAGLVRKKRRRRRQRVICPRGPPDLLSSASTKSGMGAFPGIFLEWEQQFRESIFHTCCLPFWLRITLQNSQNLSCAFT